MILSNYSRRVPSCKRVADLRIRCRTNGRCACYLRDLVHCRRDEGSTKWRQLYAHVGTFWSTGLWMILDGCLPVVRDSSDQGWGRTQRSCSTLLWPRCRCRICETALWWSGMDADRGRHGPVHEKSRGTDAMQIDDSQAIIMMIPQATEFCVMQCYWHSQDP